MTTARPGAAPNPFLEIVRPYSRLRAEAILRELQAHNAPNVFDAVTRAGEAMSRAVRSANRAPGTDADGRDVGRRDPVADVVDRLERLRTGGTIQPVAHAIRRHIGRPAEVELTRDVLAFVVGPEADWQAALGKPDVAAAFLETFTEDHAARAARLVIEQGGDTHVLDVVYSRGLARIRPAEAARIVREDEAEERIAAHGLDELEEQPVRSGVAYGSWALLTEADLLRALHGRKEVLLAAGPKIGNQLNLILAELLCLLGATRVGWGSDAWQEHDAPDPLRDCPEHPDPFDGAVAQRGKGHWNRGMFEAMDAAIEAPRSAAVPTSPPVDAWVQELVTVHRTAFARPSGGERRIVFAGQAAAERTGSLQHWASEWLRHRTTKVFRTYVQVCIDARLAIAG